MTTLTTAWMLGCVWGSGFLVGAVVASGRRRHRSNRSDVWHPIGKEPDWADLARQQLNRTSPPPREP